SVIGVELAEARVPGLNIVGVLLRELLDGHALAPNDTHRVVVDRQHGLQVRTSGQHLGHAARGPRGLIAATRPTGAGPIVALGQLVERWVRAHVFTDARFTRSHDPAPNER